MLRCAALQMLIKSASGVLARRRARVRAEGSLALHSLRPCWDEVCLSILLGLLPVMPLDRARRRHTYGP